jgi:DNA repair protein RecO (recombination protein O)
MNQIITKAIILQRTDYGEADRILTLLTPQYGKLSLLARGVRKIKSKLAGGIELFSVSEITFIKGRGDIGTLVSARLLHYYSNVISDLNRTMLGYELVKMLNRVTEDKPEEAYFDLLEETFVNLDNLSLTLEVIRFWFSIAILSLGGYSPNLQTDDQGRKLIAAKTYDFNLDHMSFSPLASNGKYTAEHIKFLRLAESGSSAQVLVRVQGSSQLIIEISNLVNTMITNFLRV